MSARECRREGEILRLGGVDYRLEAVEGQGGSSIVYRASYEDGLNRGYYHRVLVKELFPYEESGAVYRDEEGWVCCRPDGRELFETCRRGFIQGNQANLELLAQLPEQISGNINSYEAYGTLYSVLAVHGGETLEQILEKRDGRPDLKWAAGICLQVLEALEGFHRRGLLHLDVSPDNILVLKGRVLLIDYNSVLRQGKGWEKGLILSVKEGYTAPEVRLGSVSQIGPASDLFGVCAVFFRMVAGRRLTVEDLTGQGPGRRLKEEGALAGEPESAVWQAAKIAVRGLHVLARRRYPSAEEMRRDLEELILRLEGRGVSHSALWESGRRRRGQLKEEGFLERRLARRGGERETMPGGGEEISGAEECFLRLKAGENLLLSGPGGMGKSRFLQELLRRGTRRYSPKEPAVALIPLADYQEAGESGNYIRKSLLRSLQPEEGADGEDTALARLEEIFDLPLGRGGGCILLLDGLNESGERNQGLIREMEELGRKPGVGILVTDRTDAVKEYGLRDFSSWELCPLGREQVLDKLRECRLEIPQETAASERDGMLRLLSNPMMLSLYCRTAEFRRENGETDGEEDGWRELPRTMDGMTGSYLETFFTRQMRADSGNRRLQLVHGYVLRHLLPAAAGEMKRRGRNLLTFREMFDLAGQSCRRLRSREFALAFPEYAGKSRLMLEGAGGEGEWFDYAVEEQLVEQMGLLTKSEGGNYRLIHDNFLDYLAARGEENRQRLAGIQAVRLRRRLGAGLLAACVLAGAGIAVFRLTAGRGFSEKEKQVMGNAAQRLLINLQLVDLQLAGQEQILEEASSGEVLDGEASGRRWLETAIGRKREEQAHYQVMTGDGESWLEELEQLDTDIPLDLLGELYVMPAELEGVTDEAMGHLETSLCDPSSPYRTRDQRKPLVDAYGAYLEAVGDVCYLKMNLVVSEMDEESRSLVLDGAAQMEVFKDAMLDYPINPEKEEGERLLEAAENRLEEARGELRQQNFPMEAEGW